MAHLIIDQNIVTDEENKIWDFPFNAIISKFYNEKISKESIIETLEQSLSQLIEK